MSPRPIHFADNSESSEGGMQERKAFSSPSLTKLFLNAAGGLAVVLGFFFGTLYVLNISDSRNRDAVRIEHVRSLKAALEQYRRDRGTYPAPFFDNSVADLKPALVGGGYLKAIPGDPLWSDTERQYRYVSTGTTYGLLLYLESANGVVPGLGACLTGVGTSGTGWWGNKPDCPF